MNKTKKMLRFYLFNLQPRNYKRKLDFYKGNNEIEKIGNGLWVCFHNLHQDNDM